MKFIFTQIDHLKPDDQCYFLMYVDETNLYRLVETRPELDSDTCDVLVRNLNQTNDIGSFVATIRKLFCRLIRK